MILQCARKDSKFSPHWEKYREKQREKHTGEYREMHTQNFKEKHTEEEYREKYRESQLHRNRKKDSSLAKDQYFVSLHLQQK